MPVHAAVPGLLGVLEAVVRQHFLHLLDMRLGRERAEADQPHRADHQAEQNDDKKQATHDFPSRGRTGAAWRPRRVC